MREEKSRKVVAQNRKARHDFHIHETFEAGIALSGTEVKSLREGRATLADAFATVDEGEVWLRAAHIPEYSHGTWTNHTARRTRKLLLHRREIDKIARELDTKGSTLVPLALYFVDGWAKVELAVATGKREYDKRQSLAQREANGRRSGLWPAGTVAPEVARPSRARVLRLLLAFCFGLAFVVGAEVAGPAKAWAAGDQIDSFTIDYEMTPEGVLRARETIVYRFGDDSGRHGIERYFITREPYNQTQDAVYSITNITVEASDGVADQFSSNTSEAKGGREEQLRLRIGDPDETISRRHRDVRDQLRGPRSDALLPGLRRVLLGRHRVRLGCDHRPARDQRPGARRRPGGELLRRGGPAASRPAPAGSTPTRSPSSAPPMCRRVRGSRSGSRSPRVWSPTTSPPGTGRLAADRRRTGRTDRPGRRRRGAHHRIPDRGVPVVAQERSR